MEGKCIDCATFTILYIMKLLAAEQRHVTYVADQMLAGY